MGGHHTDRRKGQCQGTLTDGPWCQWLGGMALAACSSCLCACVSGTMGDSAMWDNPASGCLWGRSRIQLEPHDWAKCFWIEYMGFDIFWVRRKEWREIGGWGGTIQIGGWVEREMEVNQRGSRVGHSVCVACRWVWPWPWPWPWLCSCHRQSGWRKHKTSDINAWACSICPVSLNVLENWPGLLPTHIPA